MAQFDSPQSKGNHNSAKKRNAIKESRKEKLVDAFNIAAAENGFSGRADIKRVAEIMNVSERTIRNYLKETPILNVELGELVMTENG